MAEHDRAVGPHPFSDRQTGSRPDRPSASIVLWIMLVALAAPAAAAAQTGSEPGPEAVAPSTARPSCGPLWTEPVAAPVIDRFRPPTVPFGPGNRGLEYGTAVGDPVWAVDDGVVDFAGPVGTRRFVVMTHPSGLRSTSAYLAEVLVEEGQAVRRGDQLGLADVGFHLTARVGPDYRDPAPLLAGDHCVRPRLVPVPAGDPDEVSP